MEEIKEEVVLKEKKGKENSENLETPKVKKNRIFIKFILIILIILLIMIIALFLTYYFYSNTQEKLRNSEIANLESKFILENNNIEIEYGQKITYEDLLKQFINKNELDNAITYELSINNEKIEDGTQYQFMQIGTNTLSLKLSRKNEDKKVLKIDFENFKYTYEAEDYYTYREIKYTVNDTVKPTIEGVSDKEIYVGNEINLKEGITANDPVDGELEITIDGTVDNNTVGEYNVIAKAVDKNGNETTKEFKVTVKEKIVITPKTTSSKINSTTSQNSNSTSSTKSSTSSNANSGSSTSSPTTSTTSNSSGKLGIRYSTNSGADAETIAVAKNIISKIITSGMSGYQKIEAISKWMLNNVNFGDGTTARGSLIERSAACSGFSRGTLLLCQQAGLYAEHVNYSLWTHQYVRVWADGKMYIIDDAIRLGGNCIYTDEKEYRAMIMTLCGYSEEEF